jgi:hypothetical protein
VLVGEIGDPERRFAGQPVVRGQHHHPWLLEQRPNAQPLLVDRQAVDTDVTRPSCSTSTWSSHVVRTISTSTSGCDAVKPGVVRTPLWSDLSPEAIYDETAKILPVGRAGEPADIAAAYVYLMNQEYATGSIVRVDGGHVLV